MMLRVVSPRRRTVLVAASLLTVAGCSTGGTSTSTGAPVCGLVSPSLVSDVLGTTDVRTTGDGAVPEKDRRATPASCSIRARDAREPVIQVRIGEVGQDRASWRDRLEAEADDAGVPITFSDDPGYGYARDWDRGMYNPGSSVDVLRGDRLVRVTLYRWSGSTHEQRVDIARRIVVDADTNLDARDRGAGP